MTKLPLVTVLGNKVWLPEFKVGVACAPVLLNLRLLSVLLPYSVSEAPPLSVTLLVEAIWPAAVPIESVVLLITKSPGTTVNAKLPVVTEPPFK